MERSGRKKFMFSRSRVALLVAVSFFIFALAGCGSGSGSPNFAPPPSGSYTNASLSGAYAFSVTGVNGNGFLTVAGSLQADGNGNITSGVEDLNNGSAGVFTNVPVTGTYTVSADGRGLATLNSSAAVITIDFVIVSSQRALAIRLDTNSSASGSFDKQSSSAFSAAALGGPFSFSLSGIDGNRNILQTAGAFTADGVSSLGSGVEDFNDNGSVSTSLPLSGSYAVGASNGRGTMSLTTSMGTLNYAFYVVDANHIKLIEIDTSLTAALPAISGDAFRQPSGMSNAALNGPFAYTLGGSLFVAGGVFTSNGSGSITSGVEDFNSAGTIAQNASTTGSYSIASTGRGTLTLTNSAGTFNFVVYPTLTGGVLMMETDSSLASSGTAFAQTGTPSVGAISGNYGYNLSGVPSSGVEFDTIARMVSNGAGQFTGAADFNNSGVLSRGLAFNGSYTMGSNGRGTAALTSSLGGQNLALYFVSNSRVLFVDLDSGLVGVGDFELQQ
jgi:hypothetical protein